MSHEKPGRKTSETFDRELNVYIIVASLLYLTVSVKLLNIGQSLYTTRSSKKEGIKHPIEV